MRQLIRFTNFPVKALVKIPLKIIYIGLFVSHHDLSFLFVSFLLWNFAEKAEIRWD
jgi:hypothetical protein